MFCQHLIFTGKPLSWPGGGWHWVSREPPAVPAPGMQPRAGDPARPRGTAPHAAPRQTVLLCSAPKYPAVKQGPELHCTASHQTAPCHHSLLQAASHHTAPCHAASACSPPASTTAQQPAPPHTNLHCTAPQSHQTALHGTGCHRPAPARSKLHCTKLCRIAPNFTRSHQTSPKCTEAACTAPALTTQLPVRAHWCTVCTQSSAVAKSHLAVTKCHRHRADVQHSRKGWSVFVSVNHD